jgi:hypothetical protein
MGENTFQSFLTSLREGDSYGFSKANLFYLMFPEWTIGALGNRKLSLLCHTTTLPGYTSMSTPYKIYALPHEIPYEIAFDPVRISFYVDSAYKLPQLFDAMRNKMFDPVSFSPTYKNPDSSASAGKWLLGKVEIHVLSYFDGEASTRPSNESSATQKTIAKYTLHNTFIKSVNAMDVSWKTRDEVQEMTVDLSYEYYTLDDDSPVEVPENTTNKNEVGNLESIGTTTGVSNLIDDAAGFGTGNIFNNSPFADMSIDSLSLANIGESATSQLLGESSPFTSFVDSTGIGEAFTALTDNIPSIMSPVDLTNQINGVRIDPSMFSGLSSGMIPSFNSLPLNFDTISALNPAAATGFVQSMGITGSGLSSLNIGGALSGITNGTNALNNIMKSFKLSQTGVLSAVGGFMQPLSGIKNTLSTASSLFGSVKRTVKNVPGTFVSQFTDIKHSMPIGLSSSSNRLTPSTRKTKP